MQTRSNGCKSTIRSYWRVVIKKDLPLREPLAGGVLSPSSSVFSADLKGTASALELVGSADMMRVSQPMRHLMLYSWFLGFPESS